MTDRSSAERQRRARERRARGLAVYTVEAEEVGLEDALIKLGWLHAWQTDNRAEVDAALSAFVASVIDAARDA
jgi:hypothetical protein